MNDATHVVMLLRHPETVANVEGRYIGRGDSPITEQGLSQIEALRREVEAFSPDIVYASPLERAIFAAREITPVRVDLRVLDELTEIDFGVGEGLTHDDLHARGLSLDCSDTNPVMPGGESRAAFDERVRRAAETIERGPSRAAVMTHGGVFRRLLTHWLKLPCESGWRFAIPNSAVGVIRLYEGDGVLERLCPEPATGLAE